MGRRTVRLTLDRLDELAQVGGALGVCRGCVFWETDAVRRRRLHDLDEVGLRAAEKDAWVSEVLRTWGSCGRVALVEDRPVGLIVYAPAPLVPGAAGFATSPASPDAVLLTTLRVASAHRGGGLGRQLVQAMAADLVRRDVRAVEAFARTGERPDCLVPAEFLAHVGFRTHRPHRAVPRMRMDLRSTLTWRDEVETALERLLGVVRPGVPAPEAGRSTRDDARRTIEV